MTIPDTSSYFDLHITGLGYLNRVRNINPKQGKPFLACDIVALKGKSTNVEYCRFDVRVSGTEAKSVICRCMEAVAAERKVLIGFRLGDLYAETFVYNKGKNAGTHGVSLKARLLFVSWVKIDGVQVYKAEPKPAENPVQEPEDQNPWFPESAVADSV